MDAISTALTINLAKEATGPAARLLKKVGMSSYNSAISKFQAAFQGHISETYRKCSKIKNIIHRDIPVDFMTQYVSVNLTNRYNRLTDRAAVDAVASGSRILLCGTAGAGKTMFMKWASLTLINNMHVKKHIPLFIEMKNFGELHKDHSIPDFLYAITSSSGDKSSYDAFINGLKAGMFIVFLDAIDEINPNFRDTAVSKLIDFLRDYPLCGLAASSRFDDRLQSMQELNVYYTARLTKQQALQVVRNTLFDEEVKDQLIARLESGLFEELEEFLSNPLLVTILLLSYGYSADVPKKVTLFYQQAFEALYQRHDAAKGGYKRVHYSNLSIDQFQKVFSTFCFRTYINYKLDFSDAEILSELRESCDYSQISTDPELLFKDIIESVCLVRKDGLRNVFSHRSFQEYFCSMFIANHREGKTRSIIDSVSQYEESSNVIKMLYELSPEAFEYDWLVPNIDIILRKIKKKGKSSIDRFKEIALLTFETLSINHENRCVDGFTSKVPTDRNSINLVSIGDAYKGATGEDLLFNALFTTPLWDDDDIFLQAIPEDVFPALFREQEAVQMKNGKRRIICSFDVSVNDCNWMFYSRLPQFLETLLSELEVLSIGIKRKRRGRNRDLTTLI